VNDEVRQLWRVGDVECLMISCCAGAELQIRRVESAARTSDDAILLRELYPAKSDLYERARDLKAKYERYGIL